MKFKDYLWFLNESENANNKIVFDKSLKNFSIESIIMSHENQKMELVGQLKDLKNKDIKLDFQNVELGKVLPTTDKFIINGRLNGGINLKQTNAIYQPVSSVRIDSLNVNDIDLGKLNLDINGDNSFKKFNLNCVLENEKC